MSDDIIKEVTEQYFLFKHRRFTIRPIKAKYNCPYCEDSQIFMLPAQELELYDRDLEENQMLHESYYTVSCKKCAEKSDVAVVLDFHTWESLFYVLTTTFKEIEADDYDTRKFKLSWLNVKFGCSWCNRYAWHSFCDSEICVLKSDIEENGATTTYITNCPTCGYTEEVSLNLNSKKGLIEVAV